MLLSNLLIGLREGLEAALVVSILVAFLVRTERRAALPLVWAGVTAAVLLSVGVGAVLTFTAANLSFRAQEGFGGSASIVAVVFVTGMIFWMRRTARTIATELRGKLSEALNIGPVAVVLMAFLAVGREGLETAVFFFSSVQSAGGGTTAPLAGFLVGIAIAVVLAWLLYRGAVRVNLTRFFTVTGALLVFVAAGVLGYGFHDLQEAGVLPGLHTLAFDVSGVLPEDSWYGTLLKGIFNYSAQTTVIQAVAWAGYVAIVLPLFLAPQRKPAAAAQPSTTSA
ncbi:iron uptake transporter permease EfeU [Gandjariella thermophila]|uniref:Iron transporter n=1 Tax=Gandjariella thermophila TaxID=1931992 RepID=A0A4D4J461_9PSEU|nr:iron uptake transporter permease EfeU [Gandjariella thermophila]GDY29890.1 iron transporter [Gandjariella thermophila]